MLSAEVALSNSVCVCCTNEFDSCWVGRHCKTFVMACAQPGDLSKCDARPLSVLKHFMQPLSGQVIVTSAIGSLISGWQAAVFRFLERGILSNGLLSGCSRVSKQERLRESGIGFGWLVQYYAIYNLFGTGNQHYTWIGYYMYFTKRRVRLFGMSLVGGEYWVREKLSLGRDLIQSI